MDKLLFGLSGKKAIIGQIISVILIVLIGQNILTYQVAVAISVLLGLVNIPIVIATKKAYAKACKNS